MSDTIGSDPRAPRKYAGRLVFCDGRVSGQFVIAAYDCTGAVAKLAGIVSDQPMAVAGIEVREVRASLIVAPNGAGMKPPKLRGG